MSAEVFEFRAFQSVRDDGKPFGPNVTMAAIRKVREEQRAGRSGNAVHGQLRALKRQVFGGTTPDGSTAA